MRRESMVAAVSRQKGDAPSGDFAEMHRIAGQSVRRFDPLLLRALEQRVETRSSKNSDFGALFHRAALSRCGAGTLEALTWMRYAAFLALTLALLSGCTRTASTGAGGRHPWTVPHVLRIADLSDPDHLNPYLSEMDVSYDVSSLVYSYLVVADDRGRLIGDLASSVPSLANGGISRDGRTYVYRLRRGVLWHDGVAFTAKDVVASWHAVMDPHNNTFEHEGYDHVASIQAAGPYTVVVHLRDRY